MSHMFESGLMVRTPSWHRLENAVLKESPSSWDEARKIAGLTWDVETQPVYTTRSVEITGEPDEWGTRVEPLDGYQALARNDTHVVLSVQASSYHVIKNEEFGEVIETLLGVGFDEGLKLEALMSLYGGRQVVALAYFEEPLKMSFDDSLNFTFLAFSSRHDGQGGLRGIPTNVRVVCANTLNWAEASDGKYGFTIKHTSTWKDRVEEVRSQMVLAQRDSAAWVEFASKLAEWQLTPRRREDFLRKFLPVSDEYGERANANHLTARERIRAILESETCASIKASGYGMAMAATEWSDHVRPAQSIDSGIARQLLRAEDTKTRAMRILRSQAGIKV